MLTKSPITEEELHDAITVVTKVLEPFRKVHPTMSLQLAFSFLLVARDEGLGVSEYGRKAGIAQSVMSRHLADLGETNRNHEPGFGLVVQKVDILDRRRSPISLSPKGKAMVVELARALAGTKGRAR